MVTNFESDYAITTLGRWGLGLKARLMAAGWFAGAACVPVVLFFIFLGLIITTSKGGARFDDAIWVVWLFAGVPVSAAALMGFIFGCHIVDPIHGTTPWRAALRGMLVALFSYVLFVIAYGMSLTLWKGSYRTASLSDAVTMVVIVFLVGFVIVGWLALIVGALAGFFLYRVSRKEPGRFLDIPGESVETPNLWIVTAIALFLVVCAGLLLLGKPDQY